MTKTASSGPMLARNASAHHHAAPTKDERPAAPPFQIPGHTLYLADPQRLSVLSLSIDATTTVTTSRAAQPDPGVLASVQVPSPLQFPPSSFHNPANSSSRSRPLSHDFGQKARGALNEFGRLASRRTSALERANGAETLARVADGLHPASTQSTQSNQLRRASLLPLPSHHRGAPRPSTPTDNTSHLHLASDQAFVVRSGATRILTLVPQRDLRFASQAAPVSIESRVTSSDSSSTEPTPVEFIADHSVADESPFDPTRLLLKVRPPAELARNSWSRAASFLTSQNASQYNTSEDHAVKLRFRLRLCGSAATSTTPSSSCAERTGTPINGTDSGLGQLLFLSASSPDKLASAIEMPQSSISTAELASLEGISRVEVVPSSSIALPTVARGARDCDFEWTWKSLARSPLSGGSRCCCAFVEMRSEGKSVNTLAAFSFYIETPPPVAVHGSLPSSTIPSLTPKGDFSRSDSIALIAALNLDHDLSPGAESAPLPLSPRSLLGAEDASSNPTRTQLQHDKSLSLLIDRTELALENLLNDSPIFRAAIVNLERRTASMKKSSKALLRAAQEARSRIVKLIEAEDAMDEAFEGLVGIAPETIGRLQDQFHRQARARIMQHRREQASMIETCLERTLAQIIELCRMAQEGFKLFESESKTYYSQTQKWLSNRTNSDAPATSDDNPSALAPDKTQKHERADEKQKLRELRFEQARLNLFVMLQRLHGGKAEAHLAQSVLQISQWLADLPSTLFGPEWAGQEQRSCLSSLDAALRAALDTHAVQLQEVESRSRRLGDKIRSLEQALGKTADVDVDIVSAHRFELEQETAQAPLPNGRRARKFKSFLGSFAAGINNSPLHSSKGVSPNPGAAESQARGELSASAGSEHAPKADVRRRLSLKLKGDRGRQVDVSPSSPFKSQAPSSWRYDDMPIPPRSEPGLQDPSRPKVEDAPDRLAVGWRASPKAPRTASDGGSSAVGGVEASEQGLGIFAPASPTSARIGDCEDQSLLSSTPSHMRGGERKKEGVLWVMSKPITGPAGGDAPRGVNRATHWRECWVVLSGQGLISEFADWKSAKALERTNPLIDLRFATVREARGVDRRFAFEIVTRDSRRLFQASDEESMRDWMRAISKAIESLLNGTSSVRKLDRVIRASPFHDLDSAQRAGTFDELEEEPGAGEGNDFAVRKLLDRTSKVFSQSMTDLTASAKAQGSDRQDHPRLGAHLAALSESQAESSARASKRRSRHERGISNKTPISGYIGASGIGLPPADVAALHDRDRTGARDEGSRASSSVEGNDTEFDRRIEAVVHKSYGSHDDTGTSPSGVSYNAFPSSVDEMGTLITNGAGKPVGQGTTLTLSSQGRSDINGSMASTATSTKMSRSAEVASIARQAENQHCADCQDSDPRWASWMLANEPCCIFLCIACSGVHRSLGVHISKVKSVDLDDWTEEQVQAARDWGNARANALWEHSKPSGLLPTPGDRKDFWRIKYVEGRWKAPRPAPSAQPSRTDQQACADADATPTRRTVLTAEATAVAVSPVKRSGPNDAKAIDFQGASPEQQSVSTGLSKFAEGLGSPRPNGPRPLPNRRSVSMQSVPTSSPPQSPLAVDTLLSIDQGLRSPLSSSERDPPDPIGPPRRRDEDVDKARESVNPRIATPHKRSANLSVSASLPYLSSMAVTDPHISPAMLAARADPRLFPQEAQQRQPTKTTLQVSSPPSSYFVSNLGGTATSPISFGDDSAGRELGWDTGSETEAGRSDDRFDWDAGSPVNPPARFEQFATDA